MASPALGRFLRFGGWCRLCKLLLSLLSNLGWIQPVKIPIDKVSGILLYVRKYVFLSLESLNFLVLGKEDRDKSNSNTGGRRNEFSARQLEINGE